MPWRLLQQAPVKPDSPEFAQWLRGPLTPAALAELQGAVKQPQQSECGLDRSVRVGCEKYARKRGAMLARVSASSLILRVRMSRAR
jgi:hypothetical protein